MGWGVPNVSLCASDAQLGFDIVVKNVTNNRCNQSCHSHVKVRIKQMQKVLVVRDSLAKKSHFCKVMYFHGPAHQHHI